MTAPSSESIAVGARGLTRHFGGSNGSDAVADLTLDVYEGELFAILGAVGLRQDHRAAPDRGVRTR